MKASANHVVMRLGAHEVQYCALLAERRNVVKEVCGVKTQKYCHTTDYETNLIGVMGEFAVAKHFGIKMDTAVSLTGDDKVTDLHIDGLLGAHVAVRGLDGRPGRGVLPFARRAFGGGRDGHEGPELRDGTPHVRRRGLLRGRLRLCALLRRPSPSPSPPAFQKCESPWAAAMPPLPLRRRATRRASSAAPTPRRTSKSCARFSRRTDAGHGCTQLKHSPFLCRDSRRTRSSVDTRRSVSAGGA